ncbi:hypothetical protein M3Y98_00001000 [Aphelenchoides besseyi]|nr:hypothetical protein M3Y98_00001000 [Aphelenchoides besseyi]KAI6198432.1 hypothetical protein M3Y96_00518700 [Aphelenchoides besseyi]
MLNKKDLGIEHDSKKYGRISLRKKRNQRNRRKAVQRSNQVFPSNKFNTQHEFKWFSKNSIKLVQALRSLQILYKQWSFLGRQVQKLSGDANQPDVFFPDLSDSDDDIPLCYPQELPLIFTEPPQPSESIRENVRNDFRLFHGHNNRPYFASQPLNEFVTQNGNPKPPLNTTATQALIREVLMESKWTQEEAEIVVKVSSSMTTVSHVGVMAYVFRENLSDKPWIELPSLKQKPLGFHGKLIFKKSEFKNTNFPVVFISFRTKTAFAFSRQSEPFVVTLRDGICEHSKWTKNIR